MNNKSYTFGKKNDFEIEYTTLYDEFGHEEDFNEKYKYQRCHGKFYFSVKGKNLFDNRSEDSSIFRTYSGNLFPLIKFFCNNLYFHITDDLFPAQTIAKVAIDMYDEMRLVEKPDDDISKYADIDFDSLNMDLLEEIDLWTDHHCFIASQMKYPLPEAFIRRVEGNIIEISWDSTYPSKPDGVTFYFSHGKGVEYIDLKLYKDTVVAFCLDALDRLGKFMPLWVEEFRSELQKAIDVEV